MQGTADLLEKENGKWVLTDYKTWGSFRVARAMGIKVEGKGRGKRVYTDPSMADLRNEELQLNMYRLGLEAALGIEIDRLQLQVTVRDGSTFMATNRGITKNIYIIDVDILTDDYVEDYFKSRSAKLLQALEFDQMPEICSIEERWERV